MAFKRKARVLFVGPPTHTAMAVAWAERLGDAWVEARHAPAHTLTTTTTAWADLVVTVGAAAARDLPPLPDHVQTKHWLRGDAQTTDAVGDADKPETELRAMRAALRIRVAGLIGGLKLLARSDDGAPPPAG